MIERIIIENFKSIRKLDLELKPINILIGANGAGKSNFLSFFKLVNQIYERRLQNHIGNDIDKFLHFGRENSDSLAGLIDFHNFNAFYFSIRPKSLSNAGYIDKLIAYYNTVDDKDKQYFQKWISDILEENQDESSIQETNFPNFDFDQYAKSFKVYHFYDTGKDSLMKRVSKINDNRYLREGGENLASYFFYLNLIHPKEFNLIESTIRSVAPFFDRFDLAPDRSNEENIELLWLDKGSDTYFNAYSLSDGTLRFMALAALLMQPQPPKIIIIDEPELGLHPFAINKLSAMMRQASIKGSQIIVSTQSVSLINNFEPEEIIAVDRVGNQSVFNRLKSEDIEGWLEDYTVGELWNKNLIGAMP